VNEIDAAVEAVRAGRLAVLPADTVYGLATTPYKSDPVVRLYRAKRREESQPIALVASDLDMLLECVPELRGRAGTIARALLPGPYTLVLTNPARRFRWLTGSRPDTIGVRVPEVTGPGRAVLDRVGALAMTSANLAGGPDPCTLDEVPDELRSACAAIVDGGQLPGTASTVIDFTGEEPVVIREGAASSADALRRVQAVL
jgi:L-threonylcarbamoyladenylate synthase